MTLSKRIVAGTVIAALGAGAALPAVSDAATTVKQTSTYNISVNKGVLAGGGHTVKATAVVNNPEKTSATGTAARRFRRSSARPPIRASRSRSPTRATAACPC